MENVEEFYLTNVTKALHTSVYPTVDPTRPELSQAGKTVLITGGGTGIGLAIAHAFVKASVSTVIIVGRRPEKLSEASDELKAAAKKLGLDTYIIGHTCDITNPKSIDALWDGFKDKGVVVDVLVSNAAKFSDNVGSLMDVGAEYVWSLYEANVKAPLFLAEKLYKQGGDRSKAFINVATQASHYFEGRSAAGRFPYGMTKNAGSVVAQVLATEIPPEKMQIVSFHPGLIWSKGWEPTGYTRESLPFADDALPGSYAVWAASPEARFLHGRFVWAAWDIEELKTGELRKRIDEDPYFLKFNIVGLRLGNLA